MMLISSQNKPRIAICRIRSMARCFLLPLIVGLSGLTTAHQANGSLMVMMDENRFESVFSDEQIDSTVDGVMNDNEFRSVRRRVLERIEDVDADQGFLRDLMRKTGDLIQPVFDAIGSFFRWIFSSLGFTGRNVNATPKPTSSGFDFLGAGFLGLSNLLIILSIVGVLLVLVVIVAMVVKSMDKKREDGLGLLLDGEEDLADLAVPPGELAAATYEGRAVQLAAEGNFRGAIRELLLGSMSWIERSGLIRYRKGLTNRDYVRSIWRRKEKRDAYAVTALEFEKIYFGRRDATQESFEKCLTVFRGAFREEEKPAATV